MKHVAITLDLEEWTDLEYLKKYNIDNSVHFVPKVIPFLEEAATEGLFLTVFVVGSVARRYPDVIRLIHAMGHEVASHSINHKLLSEQTTEQFIKETREAKCDLECIIQNPVVGYRAPCFSMGNEKLDALWSLGFLYDSSLIRFAKHPLYGSLDMSAFRICDDHVFTKDGHFEFEIPTLNIFGGSFPISGGGYFRLFPLPIMKMLMKKYWENSSNFVFYIHPFELNDEYIDDRQFIHMSLRDRLRFSIGRRGNKEKFWKYLKWMRASECDFFRIGDYVERVNADVEKRRA